MYAPPACPYCALEEVRSGVPGPGLPSWRCTLERARSGKHVGPPGGIVDQALMVASSSRRLPNDGALAVVLDRALHLQADVNPDLLGPDMGDDCAYWGDLDEVLGDSAGWLKARAGAGQRQAATGLGDVFVRWCHAWYWWNGVGRRERLSLPHVGEGPGTAPWDDRGDGSSVSAIACRTAGGERGCRCAWVAGVWARMDFSFDDVCRLRRSAKVSCRAGHGELARPRRLVPARAARKKTFGFWVVVEGELGVDGERLLPP